MSISDEVAQSVARGGEILATNIVNGFMNAVVSDTYGVRDSYDNSSIALDAIFTVATSTPNPFAMPFLTGLRNDMKMLFFEIWWLLLLLAVVGFLVLFLFSRNSFSMIYDTTGFDTAGNLKKVLFVMFGGFFVLMTEMFFIWVVLTICDELTKRVMMGSLNAIAFTPDNIVLYSIMGVAYGLLGLCFIYRSVVIMFFSVTAWLFGALMLIPSTYHLGYKAHLYFIQMTFFQFVMVLWYTFCIVCVEFIPDTSTQSGMYIVMVLVSVYASYRFIFKLDFINAAGRVATIVLIKKM